MEPTLADPDLEQIERSDTLNNADRCDQCGAQAFVWAEVPNSESGLLFCSHHFNRAETKLRAFKLQIVDERWKINEKASASSPD